ncbi:MAG: hypothetical protein GY853_15685 [PVC group bacterium]|nr:hypothetical protein [PVC group bacterium]
MTINARSKGSRGEREFAQWIKDLLALNYLPKRNLEQVRSGGADILGVGDFVFEVKRVEKLHLKKWWRQVKASVTSVNDIPVVVYRQNRKDWRILISAEFVGLQYGFVCLENLESERWLKMKYQEYRGKNMNV